ncbi:MAG: hypothetical protein V5A27_01095 [Halapricum sp.]
MVSPSVVKRPEDLVLVDSEVVDEHLERVRVVVARFVDALDLNAIRQHGHDEQGDTVGLPVDGLERFRPGDEQHRVRPVGLRGPHLLPVDDELVAVAFRACLDD